MRIDDFMLPHVAKRVTFVLENGNKLTLKGVGALEVTAEEVVLWSSTTGRRMPITDLSDLARLEVEE
jgi:carbamoylphosphate synthase small subunit